MCCVLRLQIKQMKVEVRSTEGATRAALSAKVTSYEQSFARIQADYKRAKEKEEKDALMGNSVSRRVTHSHGTSRLGPDGATIGGGPPDSEWKGGSIRSPRLTGSCVGFPPFPAAERLHGAAPTAGADHGQVSRRDRREAPKAMGTGRVLKGSHVNARVNRVNIRMGVWGSGVAWCVGGVWFGRVALLKCSCCLCLSRVTIRVSKQNQTLQGALATLNDAEATGESSRTHAEARPLCVVPASGVRLEQWAPRVPASVGGGGGWEAPG
jgi:hypothetical protein